VAALMTPVGIFRRMWLSSACCQNRAISCCATATISTPRNSSKQLVERSQEHKCHRHNKNLLKEVPSPSTLYMGKRILSETGEADMLIPYKSEEGKEMLIECITSRPENYLSLSEQFLTQSSPPSCGVATLAMVLNSLKVDPMRVWRKPWRWFTEEMLISCFPLEKTEETQGLTMEHFGLIAECNGATAQTFYGSETSLDDCREAIRSVFGDVSFPRRLVVAFDRRILGQTGTGHYSPIGAYHEKSDMLLVMDVARFKYPPYWVPVEVMWKAMRTVDPETRRSRGFFIMSCAPSQEALGSSHMQRSKIHFPSIDEFLSAMLNNNHIDLKIVAANLVHDVRKRMLSCPCLAGDCDSLIDCSQYDGGTRLLEEFRGSPVLMDSLRMAKMVEHVFKTETEMRPIDFFIQSMPQFVPELMTLMITDPAECMVQVDTRLHYNT
jgi:hypothetical protein